MNLNMNMDFRPDQKQVLILAGLFCLIIAIIDITLFIIPYSQQIIGAANILNKVGTDLKNANADIAKIDFFKKEISECEEKVQHYEKMLPVEQEIPRLLESLSSIAKESNIKILGITPVSGKSETGFSGEIYREIPIIINAKCGYHELGRFIYNLESADRFMKVADIGIRASNNSPKKHDVELLVLTYILLKGK